MLKITTVNEVPNEGLPALLGKNVALFCVNYIYAGTLIGVNSTCVLLQNARIVYETGNLTGGTYKDAQALPNNWYVQTTAIESFGEMQG